MQCAELQGFNRRKLLPVIPAFAGMTSWGSAVAEGISIKLGFHPSLLSITTTAFSQGT